MGKCKVWIELTGEDDSQDAWVEPGGTLEGTVHVEVTASVRCDALSIERFWRVHGRGNRDEGEKQPETLFRGSWEPGSYSYPFSIRFGSRPPTYYGKYLNIDWILRARADIPWAFDPKDERTVLVVPTSRPPTPEPPSEPDLEEVAVRGGCNGCMIPSYLGIAIAGGLLFAGHSTAGGVVAALSGLVYFLSSKDRKATERLGRVSFGTWPRRFHPGGRLRAFVEIAPSTALTLRSVAVTLHGKESATSGSGTSKTTYTHTIAEETLQVAQEVEAQSHTPFRGDVEFEIPMDAGPSFESPSNKIEWKLVLDIEADGAGEQSYEHPIRITPSGAAEE